jgi:hypothetical protein
MKLIATNYPPLVTTHSDMASEWEKLFKASDAIRIAVGYASNDSLLYVKRMLESNSPRKFDLCLGMAKFEGLDKRQFDAASNLNSYLKKTGSGQIYIADQFKFHGKIQTFKKDSQLVGTFLGSSNLGSVVPKKGLVRSNYEVDLLLEDANESSDAVEFIDELFNTSVITWDSATLNITVRPNPNFQMESREDVATLNNSQLSATKKSVTNTVFHIPLKTEAKSNLNCYFGKGRKQNGYVTIRPWYEVELIVGQNVQRSAIGYPNLQTFFVDTDDGYTFVCQTQGGNSKNFRSRGDLTILGSWIKGRLEAKGSLVSGEPVTAQVLNHYGRTDLTFSKTSQTRFDPVTNSDLEVWYLNFS